MRGVSRGGATVYVNFGRVEGKGPVLHLPER